MYVKGTNHDDADQNAGVERDYSDWFPDGQLYVYLLFLHNSLVLSFVFMKVALFMNFASFLSFFCEYIYLFHYVIHVFNNRSL